MEWAEIKFVEENSVLLSACSTDFDADDYMGVYVDFQALVIQLDRDRKKKIAEQDALLRQVINYYYSLLFITSQYRMLLSHSLTHSLTPFPPLTPLKELMPQLEGPVPTLNLKANYDSIKEEVDAAMQGVLDSGYYVNGPAVQTFESQFSMFVGTKHCVGVSNGTDALVLALEALGVGPGDEVILQGNAFIADAMAIDAVGAKMVLVDHDDSFQLDLELLETAITEKTRAVLVVHMYGSCCDMSHLVTICATHHIKLIEDCAHAHGASWNGKFLGSFGDIGTWSFYPAKNLGAYGDAGGLTTDSDDLEDRLRLLKNYGSNRKYYNDSKGLNHRLDTIHAAVLSVKLQYVLQWNRRRQEVARLYYDLLCSVGDITFPTIAEGCTPAYHQFVICTGRRDALVHWLKVNFKMDVVIHYPVPIHKQKSFEEEYGSCSPLVPRSDASCSTILSLPMCPMMSDAMAMHVVTAVKSFYVRAEADFPHPPLCPK
jgi:dTDP-4-amino-4,6-dideoxygalactose transaminase